MLVIGELLVQEIFCQICGTKFKTDFHIYEGRTCSEKCWGVLGLKRIAAMAPKRTPSQISQNQNHRL